jgi:hypothetical protein
MNTDPKWTRRQALWMLGAGAAVAALPHVVSAEPSFPDGAVIRTVLKDYPPGELGGGATLLFTSTALADQVAQSEIDVIDGSTIRVHGEVIHIIGIDTPKLGQKAH